MTSAERTLAYTKIKPENGSEVKRKPPKDWPHAGGIRFQNVTLQHYEDGPKALRNLTFNIKPTEKIGIAGRTGAGKSSMVAALMRMAYVEGEITIDDIDIMELNVQFTRRNISVISQSPNLFSSSIRVNLDPSGNFKDSEIWDALDLMQMKSFISNLPDQLDTIVTGRGSNFSVGERQLLHLTRVSLKKNKVIVFDEATSKVDDNTDKIIQQIIRNVFKDCTVITIAHRLSTIMDCDRIILLNCGEIVEFDKPEILLAREGGLLRHLYRISEGE